MDPRGSQQDDDVDETAPGKTTMNIPLLSILWVVFFCICFLIFLVLSLCSDTNCTWCAESGEESKKGGTKLACSEMAQNNYFLNISQMTDS